MLKINIELPADFANRMIREVVDKQKQELLVKNTFILERLCKIECPVDTGDLMNSISSTINENESIIAAHKDYAKYVVEGTSKMKANDFSSRAVNEWRLQ